MHFVLCYKHSSLTVKQHKSENEKFGRMTRGVGNYNGIKVKFVF